MLTHTFRLDELFIDSFFVYKSANRKSLKVKQIGNYPSMTENIQIEILKSGNWLCLRDHFYCFSEKKALLSLKISFEGPFWRSNELEA